MTFLFRILSILFLFSISIQLPMTAHAHKLRIFAWSEGKMIFGETAFSGNRKPINAEITVLDAASHAVLLTTRTDELGKFKFPAPQKAVAEHLDLLLVVNSGEGHRGEWPMPAAEYLTSNALPANANNQHFKSTTAKSSPSPPADTADTVSVDAQLLRRIVNEELEKKLAPIKHMLSESHDNSPDLRDILGGLGYILGLAGLFAWIKNKQTKR